MQCKYGSFLFALNEVTTSFVQNPIENCLLILHYNERPNRFYEHSNILLNIFAFTKLLAKIKYKIIRWLIKGLISR